MYMCIYSERGVYVYVYVANGLYKEGRIYTYNY